MIARIARAGRGRDPRLWPVLLLLLLVVLAPTGCLLWFMGRAIENERVAFRQRLEEAYRRDLTGVQARMMQFWQERAAALESLPRTEPAPVVFAGVVRSALADSVIGYDAEDRLVYPNAPSAGTTAPEMGSPAWQEARQLEFDTADLSAAADAYAAIAAQASDTTAAARAMQAQARCLLQAGRQEDAARLIVGPLADVKYAQTLDAQGRLIVPNAELLALEIMATTDHNGFAAVAARLCERLQDYVQANMTATQRRFLMHELELRSPGKLDPSLLAAEDLAARFVDAHPSPRRDAVLQPSQLSGIWQIGLPGRRLVALFRTETILAQSGQTILETNLPDEVSARLLPPGTESGSEQAFFSLPAGKHLPGWRLALTLADGSRVDATTRARIALYGWTGVVVVVTICLVAGLIASAFRRQLRLAQLKNDLVATVSHELKTPLSSMRLLVDTLLNEERPNPVRAREYLELMARENMRLSRLIDNFLAFSRMSRNKHVFNVSGIRLEEVISAAVAAMRERLEQPGCRFQLELENPLPAIAADVDAMVTVVVNLLDNACKYTGDEKQIRLRAYCEDGSAFIAVSDNGIGLSQAAAKKVFQQFYQADRRLSRSAGGCGLGLSIVRYIVAAHGGTVLLCSRPGEGSTFTVKLPVE
ncbi:MAG: HAMP domain-containing histidine kinase [Rhodopirellula sp.]|nr:HAMP domain-containing histidine kinase [Rhodopirellula sp.]